jgi:hypothetical protein
MDRRVMVVPRLIWLGGNHTECFAVAVEGAPSRPLRRPYPAPRTLPVTALGTAPRRPGSADEADSGKTRRPGDADSSATRTPEKPGQRGDEGDADAWEAGQRRDGETGKARRPGRRGQLSEAEIGQATRTARRIRQRSWVSGS